MVVVFSVCSRVDGPPPHDYPFPLKFKRYRFARDTSRDRTFVSWTISFSIGEYPQIWHIAFAHIIIILPKHIILLDLD
jgi:hypothetical protein